MLFKVVIWKFKHGKSGGCETQLPGEDCGKWCLYSLSFIVACLYSSLAYQGWRTKHCAFLNSLPCWLPVMFFQWELGEGG